MTFLPSRRIRAAAILGIATFALAAWAGSTGTGTDTGPKTDLPSLENLSLSQLDDELQVCPIALPLFLPIQTH